MTPEQWQSQYHITKLHTQFSEDFKTFTTTIYVNIAGNDNNVHVSFNGVYGDTITLDDIYNAMVREGYASNEMPNVPTQLRLIPLLED